MNLIAKTFAGLENVLKKELQTLNAKNIKILNRAVQFQGNKELLYSANYNLRSALKILLPISEFFISKPNDLYKFAYNINWDDFFKPDKTFAIQKTINTKIFKNSHYAALKLKDAIADFFRKKYGKRPSVDKINPQIKIDLYINDKKVVISLDSSGQPLYKRKYRVATLQAPLNEVLAAGLILLSDWDKKTDFLDFMCGSGTIPIEAYLYATNTPAQILRKTFSFMFWSDFDPILWKKIVSSSNQKIVPLKKISILGADKYWKAVLIAKNNAKQLNINEIKFIKLPFQKLHPQDNIFAIVNPPYNRRLPENLDVLFNQLATTLTQKFKNSIVWIFTPYEKLKKILNLHLKKSFVLFNGSIKTYFLKFQF